MSTAACSWRGEEARKSERRDSSHVYRLLPLRQDLKGCWCKPCEEAQLPQVNLLSISMFFQKELWNIHPFYIIYPDLCHVVSKLSKIAQCQAPRPHPFTPHGRSQLLPGPVGIYNLFLAHPVELTWDQMDMVSIRRWTSFELLAAAEKKTFWTSFKRKMTFNDSMWQFYDFTLHLSALRCISCLDVE